MEVVLSPELEKLIDDQVANGTYRTAVDVIRDALRLLKEMNERKLQALRRDVRIGLDDLERGDSTEYDSDDIRQLAEDVKTRGRRRLAEAPRPNG